MPSVVAVSTLAQTLTLNVRVSTDSPLWTLAVRVTFASGWPMAGRVRVPSAAMTSGMEDVQVMAEPCAPSSARGRFVKYSGSRDRASAS